MITNFRDYGFWCSFLARTWGEPRVSTMDVVLEAGRAREKWAQADLFLAARTSVDPPMPFFFCNAYPLDYRVPLPCSYWSSAGEEADDAADGAVPLMLAEMRFVNGGYGPEAFAGSKVPPGLFAVNGGEYPMLIGPGHPALRPGKTGNLLDCYHRLLHYRHPADPLRMLVLLLDKRYDLMEVGKCLAAVEFERPGTVVIDTPKWRCKAWEIKGRA